MSEPPVSTLAMTAGVLFDPLDRYARDVVSALCRIERAAVPGRVQKAIDALQKPDAAFKAVPNTVRQSTAEIIEVQARQLDKYGLALMMIREGCADPAGLARDTLTAEQAAVPPDREALARKCLEYADAYAGDSYDAGVEIVFREAAAALRTPASEEVEARAGSLALYADGVDALAAKSKTDDGWLRGLAIALREAAAALRSPARGGDAKRGDAPPSSETGAPE